MRWATLGGQLPNAPRLIDPKSIIIMLDIHIFNFTSMHLLVLCAIKVHSLKNVQSQLIFIIYAVDRRQK